MHSVLQDRYCYFKIADFFKKTFEMNISLVHLAPKKSWIELYDKNNDNNTVSLFEMNVSLVHPAPQESLWIELYDKNTFVSF